MAIFFRWTWVTRYQNVILDFIGAMIDGSGGDNWSYKACRAPVKSSSTTSHNLYFLQTGCPSCHPTNSVRALKQSQSATGDNFVNDAATFKTEDFSVCFPTIFWPNFFQTVIGCSVPYPWKLEAIFCLILLQKYVCMQVCIYKVISNNHLPSHIEEWGKYSTHRKAVPLAFLTQHLQQYNQSPSFFTLCYV